jgi:hypothetical protein
MTTSRRLVLLGASLLVTLGACGAPKARESAPVPGDADAARCVAIADSVRDNVTASALLLGTPGGRIGAPRIPSDARPSVPVHATYLVRPDGTFDKSSLRITGSSDPRFRESLSSLLSRATFNAPRVDGCPVWSRGDFRMVGIPRE